MSSKVKENPGRIKPLSRFEEHFDLMPPTELLDTNSVEDSSIMETKRIKEKHRQKRIIPPYTLTPLHNIEPLKITTKSHEKIPSNNSYSPVSPISPSMQLSPGTADRVQINPYADSNQENNVSSIMTMSNSKNLSKEINNESYSNSTSRRNYSTTSKLDLNSFKKGNLLQQHQQQQQPTSPKPRNGVRVKYTRTSLNRAEIIIKRYTSWENFLSILSMWIADIVRISIMSQKSSGNFTKMGKSEALNKQQQQISGYMKNLTSSLEENKDFGQRLKSQLPLLEKFRKECHAHIKTLLNRPDLNLEEFLKQAQVTANLMAQLKTTCDEARRTIDKGLPLTNDPWLANLYVLRQLKKEVDEENRLRLLMLPIQRAMYDFETRIMKFVEQALTVCFERPDLLQEGKLENLQTSLNEAVTDNWETFVMKHRKTFVLENSPQKQYLKINYACKNDPLVLTLHKGELERRSGVLNKHTQRFFVLTESGFMHQFKLNDKISPEFSICVPGSTVIPGFDINQSSLNGLDEKSQFKPSDHFSFEIQRPGSALQRDKLFSFRAFSLEEMVTWSRLLIEIATRPLYTVLQPRYNILMTEPLPHSLAGNNTRSSSESASPSEKQQVQTKLQVQTQEQVTTPPPSPTEKIMADSTHLPVNDYDIRPPPLPVMEPIVPPQSPLDDNVDLDKSLALMPKLYTPQLNI